jgi:hypothetical protein
MNDDAARATHVLRPAEFTRGLLGALDASEGRRKRRARDTTPDSIGMGVKRDLLEAAARADPDPDGFEAWLLEQVLAAGTANGAVRAMALSIWDEWMLACAADTFRDWLEHGAPSDDKDAGAQHV